MKNWYGVYAKNGLGIYCDYERFLHNSKYTNSEHVQGFGEREEAEDFAINGFLLMYGMEVLLATLPDSGKLSANYFYYKKMPMKPERDCGKEKNL